MPARVALPRQFSTNPVELRKQLERLSESLDEFLRDQTNITQPRQRQLGQVNPTSIAFDYTSILSLKEGQELAIQLPRPSPKFSQRKANVLRKSTAGTVTITAPGALINGETTYTLAPEVGFTEFLFDGDNYFTTVSFELVDGDEEGSGITWSGGMWIPFRDAIKPDVDLTGDSANAALNTARINAAALDHTGCWVYIPDGAVAVTDGIIAQPGCAITGRPRGMAVGHRHFAPLFDTGTLLKVYGTGKLFTVRYDSIVSDFEIYYPDQVTSGSIPVVYDYAFYIAPNEHGTTVRDIVAINPYKLLYCSAGGALLERLQGFPLNEGIHLARCPDVIRINDVHFNPANNSSMAQSLIDHVHDTATAVLIDGAEGYQVSGLFAHSYDKGYSFEDADLDGAASYGRVSGGGLEGIHKCIHIAPTTGLVVIGGKFSEVAFVPEIGAGYHAVYAEDNFVPSDYRRDPGVHLVNCSVHSGGGGTDSPIMLESTSHALVTWNGGQWHTFNNEGALNESLTARIRLRDIGMPSGAVRTGGAGVAFIDDFDGYTL